MTFRRQLQLPQELPVIFMNDIHLERVSNYSFLGVLIEEKLNFDQQIQFVVSKISKYIFIFNKIMSYLDPKVLSNIYNTLVHTNSIHNTVAWGRATTSRLT